MSLVTRLQAARNRAVMGGAALLAGMVAAPGAWAQCTDNFNVALRANGQICNRRRTPFRSAKAPRSRRS